MSGHSKWSSIKHKKGAADAKRGKLFTKLARAITVAARDGGRRPRRQPGPGDRGPEGARRLDAEGQHPAGDRPRHRRRRRRRGDRADRLRGLRARRRGDPGRGADRQPQPHQRRRSATPSPSTTAASASPARSPGSSRNGASIVVDGEPLRRGRPDRRRSTPAPRTCARTATSCGCSASPADLSAVREALEGAGVEIESAELAMEPKSTVEVKGSDAERLLEPARRARRAGRRQRGPRQLRHPRASVPASKLGSPERRAGRHPRPAVPESASHASRDGDRPRRSQPRLRRRPGRGQPHGRPRRRRGRDHARAADGAPPGADPPRARPS